MIEEKRGTWRVRVADQLYRFPTKKEAEAFLGETNGSKNERSSDGSTAPARVSKTSQTYTRPGSVSRDEQSGGDSSDLGKLDGLVGDSPEHSDDESSDSSDR